jgi:hypothetical protein
MAFFGVLVHFFLQEGNRIVRRDSGFQGHNIVFHYIMQNRTVRKDSCFQRWFPHRRENGPPRTGEK